MRQLLRAPSLRAAATLLLAAGGALSQTDPLTISPPATQAPIDKNTPEISTREVPAVFRAHVNLVLAPVIVRDAKGATIGTFTKDNFQLFDRGKPQDIVKFSVEKSGGKSARDTKSADLPKVEGEGTMAPDIPERFVAYLFDDIHVKFDDLIRARDAAARVIASMPKTNRAAIYTTSAQTQINFTDDQDQLRNTLMQIRPHPIADSAGVPSCPEVGYYMANMIVNKHDPQAVTVASGEANSCDNNKGLSPAQLQEIIRGIAQRSLNVGDQETKITLSVLLEVVKRMAAMPGQRIVVLASPGFLDPFFQPEEAAVLDHAIRSNVIINSLDARGLWVDPMLDAGQAMHSNTQAFMVMKQQFDRAAATAQQDVLIQMAEGTGGTFIHNNNDLESGFRQLTVAPEYYYVLGFSPQNLKLDGSFHQLKVTLKSGPGMNGLNIQARRGYPAPSKMATEEETTAEEIEEAVFSSDELTDLPIELRTQYFKSSDKEATITALCHIDPKRLPFRKADDRNIDSLTIVTAVFDHNGNFVKGNRKILDMKLKDATLAKLSASNTMGVKAIFPVPPGIYTVRLVVRDSEGQVMSALSSAVAIQ